MPAMRTPLRPTTSLHRRQKIVRPDAFAQIAEIDHQHDVVHAAQAFGDARQFADDGELGLQADVDRAHHLLDARDRRAAQQHDRRGNAAVAQPADVLETRLGDPADAAAQHGARHLRHAAGPLGDAEHLDAGRRAADDDRSGVALDTAEIDGDFGPDIFFPASGTVEQAGGSISGLRPATRSARNFAEPAAMVQPTWPCPVSRQRLRKRARPITGTEFGIIGPSPAHNSALLLVERARGRARSPSRTAPRYPRPVAAVEAANSAVPASRKRPPSRE